MAIGGIGGSSNYQSIYNDYRLQLALQRNNRYQTAVQPVDSVDKVSKSTKSSVNFIKEYNTQMSDLMSSANTLRGSNTSGVMSDLAVTSSDSSVATATERYTVRSAKDITLEVDQIAQTQENISTGVYGAASATESMNFNITLNTGGRVDVNVASNYDNGAAKTNIQMLKEAADQINRSNSKITASVIEKDGTARLQITGKDTGSQNNFQVAGNMGAASGAQDAARSAQDAMYSVTEGGRKSSYTSESNQITVDMARIGVNLVSTGKTTISAAQDNDKVAAALGDFVDSYNSTLKFLNDNADRGTGVETQLKRLLSGMGSAESLKQMGISTKKDGTLSLDKELLKKNLTKDTQLTKNLISDAYGLGQKAFQKSSSALSASSYSLINRDMARAEEESYTNPITYMSMISKSGANSLNNYCALGLMVNYLV